MTLTVVGGIYREICKFPGHNEIFGSGGRAAAAVRDICPDVKLISYTPDARSAEVRGIFASFQIFPELNSSRDFISFRYFHGLASPDPHPAFHDVEHAPTIITSDPVVLRYGMVEGDCKVDSEVAIYDPQAPGNPLLFSSNGSRAKRLAYVINHSEAELLTGLSLIDEQLSWLHDKEGADVVVIKRGPLGAVISTKDGTRSIVPSYKTSSVWPIGSGDVFSAVFAAYWGALRHEAFDAAHRASLATAFYCESQVLPIPAELKESYHPLPIMPKHGKIPQVYLAGPFFNISQYWLVDSIRNAFLGMGVSVFSPVHDVGDGPADKVAPDDLAGLERSDVLFAILDGLDAGTLIEAGYAIARGIPVVAFTELETEDNMTMLIGTGCVVEKNLPNAVYKTVWAALER